MIRRYNRNQIIKAVLALAGGVFCTCLAYVFFRYMPAAVAGYYGWHMPLPVTALIAIIGMGAVIHAGHQAWSNDGGLSGYHESALYHDFGDSGGAFLVDFHLHRVTGPAHILSQVFIAGPLWIFKTRTLIASLIPRSRELEGRLASTLALLRSAHKWQPITDYPGLTTEILYLARMGLIDFSAIKGVPRIKAHVSDGD